MTDTIQFSVSSGWKDFVEKLRISHQHQFGVEIDALYTEPALSDMTARAKMERSLAMALRGFPYRRSLHGAFMDILVHSADRGIAAVARDRILRDLETASQLECKAVVFHTGFNPLVPGRIYGIEFLKRHADFWPGVANQFPGITICLENMWETSPQLSEQLLRAIDHPRVGLCLDVAHAHAFSQVPVENWLKRLRPRIFHMHWNDNHGDTDSHLAIGKGNIPWNEVQAFTRRHCGAVTVVLELEAMRAVRQSLRYLAQFNS